MPADGSCHVGNMYDNGVSANCCLLKLDVYTKLYPWSTSVCNYVVAEYGSGSIYMEGREWLYGSNQTTTFLDFPLLRCLQRIWLDFVCVEASVEVG